ncbi:MAG TPA: thiamine phosphate synthase [Beijerinckiaceae bacterium]|nr:thiamine phosphate synthase [Beijerinckiaceae bacterium]
MTESIARLYLVTPLIEDASGFAPALSQACAAGEIAAVLLRLAPGDERASVNRVKALAPAAQEHGAAVLVTAAGEVDLAAVATRGGADGVHLAVPDPNAASALRERLKDRSIGAGGLRSKDDAMTIGEAGIDYLMFGEPRADGSMPAIETVLERAAWWAEIFETPCVAFAPSLAHLPRLAATGAEFVALGDAVWTHAEGPAAAVRAALAALPAPAEEAR